MRQTMEYRALDVKASGDEMHVEGYAAIFNERALIWESEYSGYKYFEVISPGAFDGADMSNVVMRYNHSDETPLLARTTNNTLILDVDQRGLHISATLADTTVGHDVYTLIKRGDITKMSFAFSVAKESAEEDRDAKTYTRNIQQFGTIFDVAPVNFPAYEGTSLEARNAQQFKQFEATQREEQRRKMLILQTYV